MSILKIKPQKTFIILAVLLVIWENQASAQNLAVINLDSCMQWARQNYPLIKQKGYLQNMSENTQKNMNSAWHPQVTLVSSATYQSEVTAFEFPGLAFPVMPKDQYSFGLQLSQTIFDGGVTSQQKRIEKLSTDADVQKNELELYKIKDKITQLFGSIMLTKENQKVIHSYLEDINSRKEKMVSSVNSGASLQNNLDVLEVEILKTQQKAIEADANLKTLFQILSLLVNKPLDEKTQIEDFTVVPILKNDNINRPELKLFEYEQNILVQKISLSNRKALPKLSAFANGTYGREGYNFLNFDFRFYGIMGLNLSWNISNLYRLSNEKKNLVISQKIIDEQKELFYLNTNIQMAQQNGEIDKLKKELELDQTIVEKRQRISKTTAFQLDNGSITSSEYLTELTAEKQAILSKRMHEIQMGIALKNYNITTGN